MCGGDLVISDRLQGTPREGNQMMQHPLPPALHNSDADRELGTVGGPDATAAKPCPFSPSSLLLAISLFGSGKDSSRYDGWQGGLKLPDSVFLAFAPFAWLRVVSLWGDRDGVSQGRLSADDGRWVEGGDSMGGRMLGRSDVRDGFAVGEVCVRFLGPKGRRYQTDAEFALDNASKLRRQMLEPL
jgi:hypothetical protein